MTTVLQGSTAPSHLPGAGGQEGGRARVFQGGYYVDLHKMLDVSSGSQVLYVGDHIFADVLKRCDGRRLCRSLPPVPLGTFM